MKVLHVVENINRGAVENWLLRMLRFGMYQGRPLDWAFYCALGEKGQGDEVARMLGARVVLSPAPLRQKLAFMRALRRELRCGGYDIMHCHHDLVSAIYLLASIGLPIRKRILHVHNADECVPTSNRLKAWLFRPVLRRICIAMADRIVGISNHTLDTFLAGHPRRPDTDIVHYYGVDTSQFEATNVDRVKFRRQFGLPDDSRILLFAGRMVPEKNPIFAAEVLQQMRWLDPKVVGLFVGTGSLEEAVRTWVEQSGLNRAVRFLGWRDDLPQIMPCCDWFILAHPENPPEGFGLAVVEAQLAGLRLLLSRGISDDPLLPRARFRRLAISEGAQAWANAAMNLMAGPAPSRIDAMADLKRSPMDMQRALSGLLALHGEALSPGKILP